MDLVTVLNLAMGLVLANGRLKGMLMKTYQWDRYIISYIIVLLCLACFFGGHEAAMMMHNLDRQNLLLKSKKCSL